MARTRVLNRFFCKENADLASAISLKNRLTSVMESSQGDYLTRLHLVFRYCDIMGQNPEFAEPKLKELEEAWAVFEELREADL